jgi:hypothetical protein
LAAILFGLLVNAESWQTTTFVNGGAGSFDLRLRSSEALRLRGHYIHASDEGSGI